MDRSQLDNPRAPAWLEVLAVREKAYWDAVARTWQEARPLLLWRAYSDAINAGLFAPWLPPDRVDHLLKTDLFEESLSQGLYPLLKSRAKSVVGIDISAVTSHAARSRHSGLQAVAADVRQLPFADNALQIIVSNSTLDHFSSSAEVIAGLSELNRVLHPGGRLLITLDNPVNPVIALRNALPFRLLSRLKILPYYVGSTLGSRRLCRQLKRAGLDVLEVRTVMHFPRALAVAIAHILEKYAGAKAQKTFFRVLMNFEALAGWPTHFLTGYFIAVRAVKTAT